MASEFKSFSIAIYTQLRMAIWAGDYAYAAKLAEGIDKVREGYRSVHSLETLLRKNLSVMASRAVAMNRTASRSETTNPSLRKAARIESKSALLHGMIGENGFGIFTLRAFPTDLGRTEELRKQAQVMQSRHPSKTAIAEEISKEESLPEQKKLLAEIEVEVEDVDERFQDGTASLEAKDLTKPLRLAPLKSRSLSWNDVDEDSVVAVHFGELPLISAYARWGSEAIDAEKVRARFRKLLDDLVPS